MGLAWQYNSNIADEIIAAHPEIAHWVIGGHSVGGTAAALYTAAHPERIAGLAIWSSYPADSSDLSNLNIPVVLMYGGNETGGPMKVWVRVNISCRPMRGISKLKVVTTTNSVLMR